MTSFIALLLYLNEEEESMRLIIKNGRIINPATATDEILDLLVEDGDIKKISKLITEEADKVLDAKGYWVVPGFIDLHVHLREPGYNHKETIFTGSCSGAMGGFTTICAMPNTKPAIDSGELVEYIKDKSRDAGVINVLPIGSITKGQEGKELVDMEGIMRAGACGISEDGKSVMKEALMLEALERAGELQLPVFAHCEDHALAAGGVMNEGPLAHALGLKGIPPEAEDLITRRDIELARKANGKLHICHVSTKGAVEMIRQAKASGQQVTAEACPHHFTLTEGAVANGDPNTKMNPPLRSQEDMAAIIEALRDNTIEMIATDHAPHHEEEKALGFKEAPFGIVGLETALAVSLTELVNKGVLTPLQLIEKLSYNPAKLLGLQLGDLTEGKRADITIVDPNLEYEINKNDFYSKSKNTPFDGRPVRGKVLYTIVNGRIVVENGRLIDDLEKRYRGEVES